MLELYRTPLWLHRGHPALGNGTLASTTGPGRSALAFERARGFRCLFNFGSEPVPLPAGRVVLSSVPLAVDGRMPGDAAVWLDAGGQRRDLRHNPRLGTIGARAVPCDHDGVGRAPRPRRVAASPPVVRCDPTPRCRRQRHLDEFPARRKVLADLTRQVTERCYGTGASASQDLPAASDCVRCAVRALGIRSRFVRSLPTRSVRVKPVWTRSALITQLSSRCWG
jgi:hypothetical protein